MRYEKCMGLSSIDPFSEEGKILNYVTQNDDRHKKGNRKVFLTVGIEIRKRLCPVLFIIILSIMIVKITSTLNDMSNKTSIREEKEYRLNKNIEAVVYRTKASEKVNIRNQIIDQTNPEYQLASTLSSISSEKNINRDNLSSVDAIETVQVVYNDLRYRRVCTSVGLSSVLCMTIQFPFSVPLQVNDTTIRYPMPVDDRLYSIDKNNFHNINLKEWLVCSNSTSMNANDDFVIQQCLITLANEIANKRQDKQEPVVTIWTRQRRLKGGNATTTLFHGTGHSDAVENAYKFFGNNHQILVVGASPAPGVAECLHWLLGWNCKKTGVHKYPNYNCDNPIATDNDCKSDHLSFGEPLPFTALEEPHVNLGVIDFRLDSGRGRHEINNTVLDVLKPLQRSPGWTELRNLSVIVEYPFAHVQSQDMIENEMIKIEVHQRVVPSFFMDLKSNEGTMLLADQGYRFQHLFAFDGMPQHFPTETSGFTTKILGQDPKAFSYPGWYPDLGSSCRGPLPSNSMLTEINQMSRRQFEKLGHDMRWYGRTWEFVNLFWWQTRMWRKIDSSVYLLDCTHSGAYEGRNGVHKFFVQAMIDDYFENMEQSK